MNKPLLLFALLVIAQFIGCSSAEKKTIDTAESVYARAEELAKDGRTEEAINKFLEVKNRFPYSKLATDAELAAADVAFKEESYAESQAAYMMFRELHPKHPKSSLVTYHLAMSIYSQIPESIDRDLSLAYEAIEIFDELLNQYPESEHVAEAKEKRLDCLKKLAEKELYIANFYLKKGRWESALGRIEELLTKHQGLGYEEKALARGILAAKKVKNEELSQKYMAEFTRSFPRSHELDEVNDRYLSN